jgi:hypothetical protein
VDLLTTNIQVVWFAWNGFLLLLGWGVVLLKHSECLTYWVHYQILFLFILLKIISLWITSHGLTNQFLLLEPVYIVYIFSILLWNLLLIQSFHLHWLEINGFALLAKLSLVAWRGTYEFLCFSRHCYLLRCKYLHLTCFCSHTPSIMIMIFIIRLSIVLFASRIVVVSSMLLF